MKPSEPREYATTDRDTPDGTTLANPARAAPSYAIERRKAPTTDPSRAQLLDALGTEASGHIGGYRLVELVGEGAMGRVYRAQHVLLERFVAIKMLLPALAANGAATARFFAEARLLNRIEHPHVIDVTDFACDANGIPWFVMELLEGSDLADLQEHGPIELRRALEIVRQLCEALTAVHAFGIVHRDVKPQNTFVCKRDGKDYVKLIDFGVARLPDATHADPPSLVKEGMVGSLSYMAPEQVLEGPIDFRIDLYAVGGVLFDLVAGRPPFQREDMRAMLDEVLHAAPPVPSQLAYVPEAIRSDLDGLISSCLAKDPANRPLSARAIANALADLALRLDQSRQQPGEEAFAVPRAPPAPAPSARRYAIWLGGAAACYVLWLIATTTGEPADMYIARPAAARSAEAAERATTAVPTRTSDAGATPVAPDTNAAATEPADDEIKINRRVRRAKKTETQMHRDLVLDPFKSPRRP